MTERLRVVAQRPEVGCVPVHLLPIEQLHPPELAFMRSPDIYNRILESIDPAGRVDTVERQVPDIAWPGQAEAVEHRTRLPGHLEALNHPANPWPVVALHHLAESDIAIALGEIA